MNEMELNLVELHNTLRDIAKSIKSQSGFTGLPRVIFKDGTDTYRLLLQENNLGFNVSGTLNGATSYQLNTTIFEKSSEIGRVLLKMAAAPDGITVAEFFS